MWRLPISKSVAASLLLLFVTSCVGVENTVDIRCDSGLATVVMEVGIDFKGKEHSEIYPDVDTWVESFTESLSLQGEGAWAWRRDPGDIHDMDWEITGSNIPIENLSLLGMQTTVTVEETDSGRIINIVAVAERDLFAQVDAWNTTGVPTELNHNLSISGGIILENNAEEIYPFGEGGEDDTAAWNQLEPGQEARIRLREVACPVDNTALVAGGIIFAILAVLGIAWWLARHPNKKLRCLTGKIQAGVQSISTLKAGLGASLRISLFGWALALAFFVVYFLVGSEPDDFFGTNFGIVLFGFFILLPGLAIIWITALVSGVRAIMRGNPKEGKLVYLGIGLAILGLLPLLFLVTRIFGLTRF